MIDRFENAPLVELVAELRWQTGVGVSVPQQGMATFMVASGKHEEFFMQFGSKVGTLGYDRIERLVPPGFPTTPYQTIYRFRKKEQEQGTILYQIGAGVFSTNITPPYHSWKQFRPVVDTGVELLIQVRNAAEQNTPFLGTSLRYINSFTESFTNGQSVSEFIQETLGFKISIPAAIQNETTANSEVRPLLQLMIPLKIQQEMTIVLSEGTVSNQQSIIMDIMVNNTQPIAPNSTDVMLSFDNAREAIHNVFVGVTERLSAIMQPVLGSER